VGLWDAGTGSLAIERQAFFGSYFQRLEKMNNTKQNQNPQGIRNKNREITIYAVEKHISL